MSSKDNNSIKKLITNKLVVYKREDLYISSLS